jgi:hypothetical protein
MMAALGQPRRRERGSCLITFAGSNIIPEFFHYLLIDSTLEDF